MHEHDLDLIAAYADGSASAEEEETARDLVETCAECRLEMETQQEMRDLLASLPPTRLPPADRVRLRESVLSEIGRPARVVSLEQRRLRRWTAIGTVAAALLVVVGIGGVLDGEVAQPETAMAPAADGETTAAESFIAGGDDESVESDVAMASEEADTGRMVDLGEIGRDELEEAIARIAEGIPPGAAPLTTDDFTRSENAAPACLGEEAGAVAAVSASVDGTEIEIFLVPGDSGALSPSAYSLPGCTPFPLP